jgi:NADPH2:quinone reductase
MKGARVIGTTGSPEKVATARLAGASEVLLHTDAAWPEKVRDITEGYGVHLAIDGIGGTMLSRTLSVVRPLALSPVLASLPALYLLCGWKNWDLPDL